MTQGPGFSVGPNRGGEPAIAGGIRWLMILRVTVATVMLGVTVLIQLREGAEFLSTPMRGLYLFVGLAFLATLVYGLLLPGVRDQRRFAGVQLAGDLLLLSGIVLITGGVGSPFIIVYFLVIIGAGILFYRAGSFVAAAAGSLLYGLAVLAPFLPSVASLVDPEGAYLEHSPATVWYRLLLAIFGFFLVAFLSSYLTESLRRVGEQLSVASASLAELERRSEHILQNIASGLVTADRGGTITYCNRAAERIAAMPAEAVIGRRFDEVFELRRGDDPWADFTLLEGPPLRGEGGIRGSAGETLLGMTFSPLRDGSGAVAGVICAFQDLTQIRRMEEQVRRSDRLAAVGELAAGMAHEIRNPLASLSGSVKLLSEGLSLEGDDGDLMENVTSEIARLESLISDFLGYASPRQLQPVEADLLELLRETATLARQDRHGAWRITVEPLGDGPFTAEVDTQLLRQVFWNLARNALESMPGGGELAIGLEAATGEVTVSFSDSGGGIPPEMLDNIFTPFFTTKEGGTGLGLAIVFKIVEAHRGRVEVASRPGGGTEFRVRLPLRRSVVARAAVLGGAA